MKAETLFTLPESLPFSDFFTAEVPPWEWLPRIRLALEAFDFSQSPEIDTPPGVDIQGEIYIHPSVKLPPYASIQGPAYIGENTEIRPGAFIRGNVIIGASCVIGNACEYKNCLLMDHVQTPHYNYIGDSILGSRAHLGAGVILSNLRLDQQPVAVKTAEGRHQTTLKKLGALIGEAAEVGCNSSLQPGTILEKRAIVGPVLAFGGHLGPDQIALGENRFTVSDR